MSKDKGQKNQKKSPAERTTENSKKGSSYKNEGKSSDSMSVVDTFHAKPSCKSGKKV